MKKLPLLLAASLALTAAFAPRLPAQSQPQAINEPSYLTELDDDGPLTLPRHIGFGMSPKDVIMAMKGRPDEKLSADIWVYWNFRCTVDADTRSYDTLLVFFSQDRVVKYRVVEKKPVVALLADVRQRANAAATAVAKK